MSWVNAALVAMAATAAVGLWLVRPPPRLPAVAVTLPPDLQAWRDAREAGIRPDVAAQLVWAGTPGQQTEWAVVYLHGFSASPAETRPLAETVAAGLGANLFVTRLQGHGQDGAALARATLSGWWRDTAEALKVGGRLGHRVLVIGTSTGATLAAAAARDPRLAPGIDAVVLISGNFGLRAGAARLFDLPLARYWLPWIAGRDRCFQIRNAAHAAGWTSCYPLTAVAPMMALLRHARSGDFGQAQAPAMFIAARSDRVVDPSAAARVAQSWGGPVRIEWVRPGPGDDPDHHVIAGAALSPALTAPVARLIVEWIAGQGGWRPAAEARGQNRSV